MLKPSWVYQFLKAGVIILASAMLSCEQPLTSEYTENLPGIQADETSKFSGDQILSWEVSASSNAAAIGQQIKLKAMARLINDPSSVIDISDKVVWQAPAEGLILDLNTPGQFQAKKPGTFKVKTILESKEIETEIKITEAVVENINLTPSFEQLPLGAELAFTVLGLYSSSDIKDIGDKISVKSLDSDIFSATMKDSKLIIKALGQGTGQVEIKLKDKVLKVNITVGEVGLYGLELSPNTTILPAGLEQETKVMGLISSGEKLDLSTEVKVTSSSPEIIEYKDSKLIAKKKGHSLITVTQGKIQKVFAFAVTDAILEKIELDAESKTIPIGVSTTLTVTGTYSDGLEYDLTSSVFLSRDSETIFELKGNQLTASSLGQSKITAIWRGLSSELSLQAVEPVVASIKLSPDPISIPLDEVQQKIIATATFTDGSLQDVTEDSEWSIKEFTGADNTLAISNDTGSKGQIISSSSAGSATISVSFTNSLGDVLAAESQLMVTNFLSSIRIVPESDVYPPDDGTNAQKEGIHIANGLPQNLRAEAVYLDGSIENISDKAWWYIDYYSPGLGDHAYINRNENNPNAKQVISKSQGSVLVIAIHEGQSAQIKITVGEPIFAAEGISCSTDSGSFSLAVDDTVSIDCQITLTDGTTLSSSDIDQDDDITITWNVDASRYSTFPSSGTLDSFSTAKPSFNSTKEGYLDLTITAEHVNGRSEQKQYTLKIYITCPDEGLSFGGEVENTDGLFCWFLGEKGDSCTEVCGQYDGYQYHEASKIFGEDAARCQALQESIYQAPASSSEAANFDQDVDPSGLGCAINEFTAFDEEKYHKFLGSAPVDPDKKSANVRRICACGN